MFDRARARCRMAQHANRAIVAAMLVAACLTATAAPAGAWQTSFSVLFPTQISAPDYDDVSVSHGSFGVVRLVFGPDSEDLLQQHRASAQIGQSIADTALMYVGYPYVAGGAGPGGFDCSGFTQFIVGITTGIWVSHAVEAQPWSAGVWVEYGAWQTGDLIFFQNTYRAGISHVGIYIGDGLIVHAENYGSGVTIDSIYSSYYGPRYWGAVRVA